MKKKNNKTLQFVERRFSKSQNSKGGNKRRSIWTIDENKHEVFMKILQASNNPKLSWKFSGEGLENSENIKNNLVDLHEKLIELKLIIPNKNENSNL